MQFVAFHKHENFTSVAAIHSEKKTKKAAHILSFNLVPFLLKQPLNLGDADSLPAY